MDRSSEDYQTLLKTVWAEARGEPVEGQQAVAWVIRNRADKNKRHWGGSTIRGVCRQPYQFSCWDGVNDIDMSREGSARDRIDDWLPQFASKPDPSGGATHYYAHKGPNAISPPSWANPKAVTVEIGNHKFFKLDS